MYTKNNIIIDIDIFSMVLCKIRSVEQACMCMIQLFIASFFILKAVLGLSISTLETQLAIGWLNLVTLLLSSGEIKLARESNLGTILMRPLSAVDG